MKKFRDELGLFVAEGSKCVEELRKGFEPVAIYREGENATSLQIKQMSGLENPQGVIGVFKKRPNDQINDQMVNGQIVLALDGIQNPGNLGTIIRTADWFGVRHIVCSRDTADCYNPKVVQATMGALTRVRIHYADLPEWLSAVSRQHSDVRIFGTLLDGRDMYEELSTNEALTGLTTNDKRPTTNIIVMGNEGNGISPEVHRLITHPIRIPSYPKDAETSESLNVAVATAIVLAAFRFNQTSI